MPGDRGDLGVARHLSGTLPRQNLVRLLALDDESDPLADADAHGREATAGLPLAHFVHERRDQTRTRATERMAERDGSAVDVHPLVSEAELADARQGLGR